MSSRCGDEGRDPRRPAGFSRHRARLHPVEDKAARAWTSAPSISISRPPPHPRTNGPVPRSTRHDTPVQGEDGPIRNVGLNSQPFFSCGECVRDVSRGWIKFAIETVKLIIGLPQRRIGVQNLGHRIP